MRRRLIAAAGLCLAAATWASVGVAVEARAKQDPDPVFGGTMELSPDVVAPGEEVTAESTSPCNYSGDVAWTVIRLGAGATPVLSGSTQADVNGMWSVVFAAPDAPEGPRAHRFAVECTGDDPMYIYSADFTVEGAGLPGPDPEPDPAPTPTPTPAAPASPVRVEPDFAG
jgi:hypothetical protein